MVSARDNQAPKSRQLDKGERGELSVKTGRKRAEAAGIGLPGRRIPVLEIAPSLVSALGHWRDELELVRADDVDATVAPFLEAEDLDPRHDAMLEDVVELAA